MNVKPDTWLFLASLFLYVLLREVVFGLMGFEFLVQSLLRNVMFSMLALFAIFSINAFFRRRLDRSTDWNSNPVKRFIDQSIAFALLSTGLVCMLGVLFEYLQYKLLHASIFISVRTSFISFLICAFVIELTVLFDFGRYLLQKWNSSRIEQEKFQKEKAQFNLELLRTQINPHFLFNNLNTLSSLIYENQDRAAGFLRKLSTVYRNILEYRNRETVDVSEEVTFFNTYSELLSIRFENMLFFELSVEQSLYTRKIIPLTVQMLVENAIKHNVISKSRPLTIRIYNENENLVVENNLQARDSVEFSSGLGLTIISSRFELLTEQKVEIRKTGTSFKVLIPTL